MNTTKRKVYEMATDNDNINDDNDDDGGSQLYYESTSDDFTSDDDDEDDDDGSSSCCSGEGEGSHRQHQPHGQQQQQQQQRQRQPSQEIESVRELNRLLESALRIGVQDEAAAAAARNNNSTSCISSSDYSTLPMETNNNSSTNTNTNNITGDGSASWRLDTARRLSSLLSSQTRNRDAHIHNNSTYDNSIATTNNNNNSYDNDNDKYNNNNNNLLLPALKRQSRYWIPLLLSWLRQDTTNDYASDQYHDVTNPNTTTTTCMDSSSNASSNLTNNAQFAGKSSRRNSSNNNRNNASGGAGGGTSSFSLPLGNLNQQQQQQSRPEVQIEALRALTALTEWTDRMDFGGQGGSGSGGDGVNNGNSGNSNNSGTDNTNSSNSNNYSAHVTAGCNPHNPISSSSQRLLLRHADAIPMIVSLLNSPDPAIHEQAVWILGSISSGGLAGTTIATSGTSTMGASSMGAMGHASGHAPISPMAAAANAAAAEVTKVIRAGGPGCGLDGSVSVAMPSPSPSSSSVNTAAGMTQHGNDARNNLMETMSSAPLSDGVLLDDPGRMESRNSSSINNGNNGNKDKSFSSSSISARDVILAAGIMNPLLCCLDANPHNVSLHRIGAWCLSSLVEGRYSGASSSSSTNDGPGGNTSSSSTRGRYNPSDEINVIAVLPTLKRMLYIDDAEVLTFTCWTLSHLCDGPAAHIAAVIYSHNVAAAAITTNTTNGQPTKKKGLRTFSPEGGLVPRLVELLVHPSPKVAKPALRTIGNIVCAECSDQQNQDGSPYPIVDYTEVILECNAVPQLRQLVDHGNREIQKEACWTLSNIAAGTTSQIQSVIESGAIPPLVNLVNSDTTDKEVRSEACWVVLNATSCGSDEQIEILVEEGCVSVLGVLLNEPSMVMMALEGLERVLQMEEAKDAAQVRSKNFVNYEPQRQTTLKCAALIKGVTESPQNSGAVSKLAKRIWETHFVSCALCHGSFSRHRINDARFCNECKCYVCSQCDCRVYHLSYQEELWAEDEGKAEAKKNAKKSKKQKKKEKEKQKKEKKKQENQVQQPAKATAVKNAPNSNKAIEGNGKSNAMNKSGANSLSGIGEAAPSVKSSAKSKPSTPSNEHVEHKSRRNDPGPSNAAKGSRKTTSSSPSRGTIDDDTASLGMDGDGVVDENENNTGQPPIDLVLYLQQTGSIIALAKLMDSLYDDNEYGDDGVDGDQSRINMKNHTLTTQ